VTSDQIGETPSVVGEQLGAPAASDYCVDVNADGETSALDALQVINYVARLSDSLALAGGGMILPQSASRAVTDFSDSQPANDMDVLRPLADDVSELAIQLIGES
jgi:hypothetical protein